MTRRPSRSDELALLGRRLAAAQSLLDDRPEPDWIAYGQACSDALARRRPVPALRPIRPALPPPPPPAPDTRSSAAFAQGSRSGTGTVGTAPVSVAQRLSGQRRLTSMRGSAPALRRRADSPTPSRRPSVWRTLAWGLTWRYVLLAALLVTAQGEAQKPWLIIAGVVVAGLLSGLWRSRRPAATIWRNVVVAGAAVYIAPLFSFYPLALTGSLGALTFAPVVGGFRRRRGHEERQ